VNVSRMGKSASPLDFLSLSLSRSQYATQNVATIPPWFYKSVQIRAGLDLRREMPKRVL
jgi:hypothetical protein